MQFSRLTGKVVCRHAKLLRLHWNVHCKSTKITLTYNFLPKASYMEGYISKLDVVIVYLLEYYAFFLAMLTYDTDWFGNFENASFGVDRYRLL
jgi:hypothetical protein